LKCYLPGHDHPPGAECPGSLLTPFQSVLRPVPEVSISLRLAGLQLLASVAVFVPTKLVMFAAVMPGSIGFMAGLSWIERVLLMRACLYQGLTLVMGLGVAFLASMYMLPTFRPHLRRGVATGWAVLFFVLSAYSLGAFLHWEHFFSYPSWVELRMSGGAGPLLASLGRLADDRAFAALAVLFALAHGAAFHVAVRSTKPLTSREVRVWGGLCALITAYALSGWFGPRMPVPRPVTLHPVVALLYPTARFGAPRALELGPPQACPSDIPVPAAPVRYVDEIRQDAKPDVVVVFWESAPARSVYPWCGDPKQTPALAARRDRACVMERVYSNGSLSFLARFNFLFGQYSPLVVENWGIPSVPFSLPNVLRANGWTTAAIGSNDMQFSGTHPMLLQAGFELVEEPTRFGSGYVGHLWGVDDRMLFDRIKKLLQQKSERPRFVFGLTSSSHHPYQHPLPGVTPASLSPRDLHAATLRFDDALLGDLVDFLEKRPGGRPTLLLIVGDHGECFGERPGHVGHGSSLYEEVTHVACLIFDSRGNVLPPSIPTLGSILDLAPTLLELLSVSRPPEWQGRSLLGSRPDDRNVAYLPYLDGRFSWREGRYKLVAGAEVEANELYDLEKDPGEMTNLAARRPELVDCYRRRLAKWLTDQTAIWQRWLR
jgi:arylsulfatase A-like enzyme